MDERNDEIKRIKYIILIPRWRHSTGLPRLLNRVQQCREKARGGFRSIRARSMKEKRSRENLLSDRSDCMGRYYYRRHRRLGRHGPDREALPVELDLGS